MFSKSKVSCVCDYFQQYLSIFYALYISPLRLKWDSSIKKYNCDSSTVHKVVFYIIVLLHISYFLFGQYKSHLLEQAVSSQAIIFRMSVDFAWILQSLTVLNVIIMYQKEFIQLINDTADFCTGYKIPARKVMFSTALASFAVLMTGIYDAWLFFRKFSETQNTTTTNWLIYAFTAPLIALHPVSCNFPEGFWFIFSIVLVNIGKHFVQLVQIEKVSLNTVQEYTNLRSLVESANSILSPLVFCNFISVVLFYAKVFTDVPSKSLLESIDILIFGIVNSLTWLNVAKFHKLVSDIMRTWLYSRKDLHNIPLDSLAILINDLTHNPLGIKCNFFVVSYTFLGTMAGLIITYGTMATAYESSSRV